MTLAEVIKQVESNGNQYALRFEPIAFRNWPWSDNMTLIQQVHNCSASTAKMIACTSWGAYQIMGDNIWNPKVCGFPAPVITFLNTGLSQDTSFHGFLIAKGINYSLEDILGDEAKMTNFVTHWNGPGNVEVYSALVRKAAGA